MADTVDVDILTGGTQGDLAWRRGSYSPDLTGSVLLIPDPPLVSSVSPSPGTTIQRYTAIVLTFSIPDDAHMKVGLAVSFAGSQLVELVYDGSAFTPMYSASSSYVATDHGSTVTLARAGGWPGAPTLSVFTLYTV